MWTKGNCVFNFTVVSGLNHDAIRNKRSEKEMKLTVCFYQKQEETSLFLSARPANAGIGDTNN